MIQIGDAIVSTQLLEKRFCCDLEKCKGVCCVEGDSGAPLEDDEADLLKSIYPKFKKYLTKKSIDAVKEQGLWFIDKDGDKVTPLVNGQECAYVYYDEDIAKCAIEKAFFEGLITFRKPISCHLYPIRIDKLKTTEAVNYHRWELCKPAEKHGTKENILAYKFLSEPIQRKFGKKWYKELCLVADEYAKQKNKKD